MVFLKKMRETLRNIADITKYSDFNGFFIKQREFITVEEFDKIVKVKNIDELDKTRKIYNLNTILEATGKDVSFLINEKYMKDLQKSKAGFCFVNQKLKDFLPKSITPLVVDNPHFAYCAFLQNMYFIPLFLVSPGISPKANVDETARIGKNVEIQAGAFVDKNVVIGDNCKICANSVINHGCIIGNNTYIGANATISYSHIGNNVIIQNGANIGQCGYGFAHDSGFNYKIPQLGTVKICDYVEVGAGTCIDRGVLEETIIGQNTKLDNLIQIAHNVEVGMGCFMASQVGIAGSTKIGNFVQFGGQTGIVGHVKIGDLVQSAGQTGILGDIEKGAIVGGSPALPLKDWLKSTAILQKLINKKKGDKNE